MWLCLSLASPLSAAAVSGLSITKSAAPVSGLLVGDTVNVCLTVSSDPPKADIVWIIDQSTSMDVGINNIIANIITFTAKLSTAGIDYRQGLVTFTGGLDAWAICSGSTTATS